MDSYDDLLQCVQKGKRQTCNKKIIKKRERGLTGKERHGKITNVAARPLGRMEKQKNHLTAKRECGKIINVAPSGAFFEN